jgi:hypothetical protein
MKRFFTTLILGLAFAGSALAGPATDAMSGLSTAEILKLKSLATTVIVYDKACTPLGYPGVKPAWLLTMKQVAAEHPELDKEALVDSAQMLGRAPGGDACSSVMLFFRKQGYVD